MKTAIGCLLGLMLLPLATPAAAQDMGERVAPAPQPGMEGPAVQQPPPPARPEPPPPDDRPPLPRRRHVGRGPQDGGPQPPRERPAPRKPPVGDRPAFVDPFTGERMRLGAVRPRWAPLMRLIAERRPELARRLERLRRHDPDRFRDVLVDAFIVRIEQTLDETEADIRRRAHERKGRHEGPPPFEPGPEGPPPPERELEQHMRELHQRHEQLEMRSHELAEQLKRLRHEEGHPHERERLHDELHRVVNEQFEVRGQLRRVELERIERELLRLKEVIERTQHDLERRERERGPIIERRVGQLLGQEHAGW